MSLFDLRPAGSVRFDEISLGEVMLRLDPGEGRIRTARQFQAWEGGGEYNVADHNLTNLEVNSFKRMITRAVAKYPNVKAVATTLRAVRGGTVNDRGAVCWAGAKFYEAKHRPGLAIMDRVGGGDSFASGPAYGFLSDADPQTAVDYGAAHGALAMTTPGNTSMASLSEVKKLAAGGDARVER